MQKSILQSFLKIEWRISSIEEINALNNKFFYTHKATYVEVSRFVTW